MSYFEQPCKKHDLANCWECLASHSQQYEKILRALETGKAMGREEFKRQVVAWGRHELKRHADDKRLQRMVGNFLDAIARGDADAFEMG